MTLSLATPRQEALAVKALADALPISILVVDDDPTKRSALRAALSPLGFTIVEADSGIAALRCIMAQNFAIILLDVFMPTMDGFKTASLIRQRKESEATPIIFITAAASEEIPHTDRFSEGAVDFIFAPINPCELRAKVSAFAGIFAKSELLARQMRDTQTSVDHLGLVTDVAPIGIFQTDTDGCYVYTNLRWSEITGIAREDAIGRTLDSVVEPECRKAFIEHLHSSERDMLEFSHKFEISQRGPSSRVVSLTAVPIPNVDGGTHGLIGIVADVTAEATAEAAMSDAHAAATSASQLKSDFLANMSHEIRTPMNGVIGMTDLLLETKLDAHQRDYAQTVRNSGEALLAIINDILDFSKVEAGMLEIEDNDFDLGMVVDSVVDLMAASAHGKGIELVAAVESSVPSVVRGDSGRLRQVLMNLVGNAIKFTQSGDVVVRVTVGDAVGRDRFVRFGVSDTGVGIDSDKIGAIFQPFVQADTSTSRRFGGTGLGLAISGQLITLMGGDFGASSQLGAGSIFWFTIRVRPATSSAPDAPAPPSELIGMKVLVVDDNASQRAVLSDYLTDWGMTVTTAETGRRALEILQRAASHQLHFDVALIDSVMPEMNGLELKDAIASRSINGTPLILMTGRVDEHEIGEVARSAFHALLFKPVHRNTLLDCLRSAFGLGLVGDAVMEPEIPDTFRIPGPRRGRLLLAEDNPINRKVALAMLSGVGYQVDCVYDGAGAVQATESNLYDAILMDCQMPGMNGYEATAAIRHREGAAKHTPIIALTAGARTQDKERCLNGGMDGYLAKPISKDALLSVVASFVQTTYTEGGLVPAWAPALPAI